MSKIIDIVWKSHIKVISYWGKKAWFFFLPTCHNLTHCNCFSSSFSIFIPKWLYPQQQANTDHSSVVFWKMSSSCCCCLSGAYSQSFLSLKLSVLFTVPVIVNSWRADTQPLQLSLKWCANLTRMAEQTLEGSICFRQILWIGKISLKVNQAG